MTEVTRDDVLEAVAGCFRGGGATRDDLIEQALQNGAHPAVIEILRRLPDRRIGNVRQIWELVPDIPVQRR